MDTSTPSCPPRRESGDDRRAAIARAARAIIVEKGLEGLRTRDIAARVGINIATLHYHVPSKEALVALVAESLRADFREQGMRQNRTGKNALGLFHLELADFRETIEETPELIFVLTELTERARRDEGIAAIIRPLRDYWSAQFADIFRLGIADGSFRPDLNPQVAAHITTGSLSDFGRYGQGRTDFTLAQLEAELEASFISRNSTSQG